MSTDETLRHELQRLRTDWWWILLLGIGLIVLGLVAIGSAPFVSIAAVVLFGFLLLAGGIAQVISAFWAGQWSGFMLHLLVGILYVVAGYFILDEPVLSTTFLTLVLAVLLVVSGIFRIITALTVRFPNWGWVLLSGIVSLILGLLIRRDVITGGETPEDIARALMWIGIFIGAELIFNGWFWVMLAISLRRIPANE